MKKILKLFSLFLVLVCFVVGCGKEENTEEPTEKNYLTEITFTELKQKLDNNDDFILEIIQDGCSNCALFGPRFENVVNEYEISAYKINISYFDQEGSDWLDSYKVDGTPTVLFFFDGKETSTLKRIEGNVSEDRIISKLKANGYIKD